MVLAVSLALLAVGVPLVAQLRSLDADRLAGRRTAATLLGATATRVVYSILVVTAFALLPLAWALGAIPLGGLAPFLAAPLAIRLGDLVSHRSGAALGGAPRDAMLLVALFALLYVLGVWLSPAS